MSGSVFLDTNILIYLYSEDENTKRDIACKIANENCCVTSTQAFNEASNIWFKKYSLSKVQIVKYLDELEAICDEIILIRRKTINQALFIKERYGYSYYDCLMLASALDGNCNAIITEDMNDKQILNGVLEIVNPFKRQG